MDITFDPCALSVAPASNASEEQVASIESAIRMWNTAGNFGLTMDVSTELAQVPIEFEKAAAAFHGYYDDEAGIVIVNRSLAAHELAVTVAHELGHAFGLWHVASSTRTSIMNPGNDQTEPTARDVSEVQAIWGACGSPPSSE
jgi:Zn-dependent peptidase ImmA (M78 family)